MSETFSFNYFGSVINAESLGVESLPPLGQTLTAHCVPFTADGKIVAVNVIGRGVDIPGGHIDANETAIEAMQREAQEEARITVSNPVIIDVWRLSSTDSALGLSQKPFILLYSVEVESMEDFHPNDEVSERLVLEPNDFIASYFGDKRQARVMVEKALTLRR